MCPDAIDWQIPYNENNSRGISMVNISYGHMVEVFSKVFLTLGLTEHRATLLATILADNTRDGVASHGVNRFHLVVNKIKNNTVDKDVLPVLLKSFGAFEQWDGQHGIGPLNALAMVDRAMELADEHGIGLVAIRNTDHWMRGATYGYRAAEKGYVCICWTNTIPLMPSWPNKTITIGNNPIVFAIPKKDHPVVLDMALSQFSFGKLESARATNTPLVAIGGYDKEGRPTNDASAILDGGQAMPIGLYKGSGLSLLLDICASVLSSGTSTTFMDAKEHSVSQIFITIHPGSTKEEQESRKAYVESIIEDLKKKSTVHQEEFRVPGERTIRQRAEHLAYGIDVDEALWDSIVKLLSLS
jgi:3-dehydro-L-gulonate 2-dehydrogenase